MSIRSAIFTTLAVCLLATGAVTAQVKKGKTRLLQTEQLMEGLVKPSHAAIKKTLEAAAPTDDDWKAIAMHAALLNESTYTMMDDGRSPDTAWSDAATKAMRQGSADLVKAADAKDQPGAKTALAALGKSCKACHEVHKKKKQ